MQFYISNDGLWLAFYLFLFIGLGAFMIPIAYGLLNRIRTFREQK